MAGWPGEWMDGRRRESLGLLQQGYERHWSLVEEGLVEGEKADEQAATED